MSGRILIIFLKEAVAGRVKTRLAATLGAPAAVDVYRHLVAHTLRVVAGLQPDVEVWFYADPAERLPAIQAWIQGLAPFLNGRPGVRWIPQPPGDLGERLQFIFQQGFGPAGAVSGREGESEPSLVQPRVCAIGTDCPEIEPSDVMAAFASLDHAPCVLGPASDGGYWLMGLRRVIPGIFSDVRWSHEQTLADTVRVALADGITPTLLGVKSDVDTEADWLRWQQGAAAMESGSIPPLKSAPR